MIITKTETTTICDACKQETKQVHGDLKMTTMLQDMSGHFVGANERTMDHLCGDCTWAIDKFIKSLRKQNESV